MVGLLLAVAFVVANAAMAAAAHKHNVKFDNRRNGR